MKKTSIFITCLALLVTILYACKKGTKNNNEPNNNAPHLIEFNTSGFTASTIPITAGNSTHLKTNSTPNTKSFSDSVKYLVYLLLDNNNNIIKRKTYSYDSAGFGTVKDSISSGTYTALFIASPIASDPYGYFDATQLKYDFEVPNIDPVQFPPLRYKKLSFTVGSTNSTQSVQLTRITGQLLVIIKDALPANASYIKVKASGDMSYYSVTLDQPQLITSTYSGETFPRNVPEDQTINNLFGVPAGTTNFTTTPISILNTLTPMTVTVGAYTSNDVPIAVKTISNVTFQRNTRTILSGNLFLNPSSGGSGFGIHYSTGLADSTTVHF